MWTPGADTCTLVLPPLTQRPGSHRRSKGCLHSRCILAATQANRVDPGATTVPTPKGLAASERSAAPSSGGGGPLSAPVAAACEEAGESSGADACPSSLPVLARLTDPAPSLGSLPPLCAGLPTPPPPLLLLPPAPPLLPPLCRGGRPAALTFLLWGGPMTGTTGGAAGVGSGGSASANTSSPSPSPSTAVDTTAPPGMDRLTAPQSSSRMVRAWVTKAGGRGCEITFQALRWASVRLSHAGVAAARHTCTQVRQWDQ